MNWPAPYRPWICLCLQRGQQLRWVNAVILDGIGRTGHLRLLQARDAVEHPHLHVLRHGGGEALDVQLLRVQPHRLHKELVALLIREADDLCLNGGAVPRADALDGAISTTGSDPDSPG